MSLIPPPPNNADTALSKWLHTAWKSWLGNTQLTAAVDDAAAATAGVPIGGIYRNGSVVMVRVV